MYPYNNVAKLIEFKQTISRLLLRPKPSSPFIYHPLYPLRLAITRKLDKFTSEGSICEEKETKDTKQL